VVSFTPRPLYPEGRNPWYPLDRRLVGAQNRSGRGGVEKNVSCDSLQEHVKGHESSLEVYGEHGKYARRDK
jgi:hypothetical protein